MAYTPTTWNRGDTVTSIKLNKLEQGVANAGGPLIVTAEEGVLDKTFTEIYTALHSGTPVYLKIVYEASGPSSDYECYVLLGSIFTAHKYNDTYAVYARTFKEGQSTGPYRASSPCVETYHASSANSYPIWRGMIFPQYVSFQD